MSASAPHDPLHDALPDPLLEALSQAAALASRWPTLHAWGPDESSLLATQAALVAQLGALPQADIIEPFEHSEPWELRVDVPGLVAQDWLQLSEALPQLRLARGCSPAERCCNDLGLRTLEQVVAQLQAWRQLDDGGEPLPLDLIRPRDPDPSVRALERELTEVIRDLHPALGFVSDRGPDTVQPVLHPSSGRFGVELSFSIPGIEALLADHPQGRDPLPLLLEALAPLVRARADHPVRLAPDLHFSRGLGLTLVLWFIAAPVQPYPSPAPRPGLWPPAEVLAAQLPDWPVEEVEITVVPTNHHAAIDATAGLFGEVLVGSLPNWSPGPDGRVFCPRWRLLRHELGAELRQRLVALSQDPAVWAVLVRPFVTPAPQHEAHYTWVDGHRGRVFVRVHDTLSGRDLLAVVRPEPDAPSLAGAQAVRDAMGRRGLRLRVPYVTEALLAALPEVPGANPMVTWGRGPEGHELRFWMIASRPS